jgi:hypothetical protein
MTTPPIPPNCNWFRGDNEFAFRIKSTCLELWYLDVMTPDIRKLIACYCRCAWLDEAERLSDPKNWIKTGNLQPYTAVDQYAVREAKSNADLWKKWGEE